MTSPQLFKLVLRAVPLNRGMAPLLLMATRSPNRGTAAQRGYGTKWRKLRKYVLQRDKGLCQHCLADGLYRQAVDVDHKLRRADGGTDTPDNLQSLCRAHHKAKTASENSGTEKLASGCSASGIPLDPRHHWGMGSKK